jgi:predicted restriction endonuclease
MKYAVDNGLCVCHDTHIRFHKDWFSHSEVDRVGDSLTDSMEIA